MKSKSFASRAGQFAILAGISSFLYSVSFVILRNDVLNALFLLLGGLFGIIVMTALYEQLLEVNSSYALLAFLFSAGALAGSLIHGGSDLSHRPPPPPPPPPHLPPPPPPPRLLALS